MCLILNIRCRSTYREINGTLYQMVSGTVVFLLVIFCRAWRIVFTNDNMHSSRINYWAVKGLHYSKVQRNKVIREPFETKGLWVNFSLLLQNQKHLSVIISDIIVSIHSTITKKIFTWNLLTCSSTAKKNQYRVYQYSLCKGEQLVC